MIYPVFEIRIRGGKAHFRNREAFDNYLASLEGRSMLIVVADPTTAPTWEQHKYYQAVVLPLIAEQVGCTPEKTHYDLCERFYQKKGKGNCTSKMSRAQMSAHIDRCTRWAFDFLGLIIPAPNQVIDLEPGEIG